METESHDSDQELRTRAAALWTRIGELEDDIATLRSEFAKAERIWIEFDLWPSHLKEQHLFDVKYLSKGNLKLDALRLAPIAESANSILLAGRTHEQLLEAWCRHPEDISRRIGMVIESPNDQGQQEMLQAELGIQADDSKGVRFVEGFPELLEELKSLFLTELAIQSDRSLDSIAVREKLWDEDSWSVETVSRFDRSVELQNAELNALQSQLRNIPIDLRYPDDWYRYETLGTFCSRTEGCESFHETTDIRTLRLDEILKLTGHAPRFDDYLSEKLFGMG